MNKFDTTLSFINSHVRATGYTVNDTIEMEGFTNKGDLGAGRWRATGLIITASQTPLLLDDIRMSDASGNEFKLDAVGVIDLNVLGGTSAAFVNIATAAGLVFSQGLTSDVSDDIKSQSTVATMTAATGLQNGNTVETGNFLTDNGGGGTYDVVLTSSVTPLPPGSTQGADIIVSTADPLISFVLRTSSPVNVKAFGAVGDDVADDTAAIQATVDFAEANAMNVKIPNATYRVSSTIIVPFQIVISGENSRLTIIKPYAGTYSSNALFLMNTIDGITWAVQFPNIGVGGANNIFIDNIQLVPNLIGFIAAGSYEFENLKFNKMTTAVQMTADYNDKVSIRRIYAPNGTGIQVIVNQLGDGLIIEDVHTPPEAGQPLPDSIRVVGCHGGTISQVLTGNIELFRCANVTLRDTHTEGGTLKIDSSSVKVEGYFTTPSTNNESAIIFSATDDGKYYCTIERYYNAIWDDRIPATYYEYDIKTHPDFEISIVNCFRRAYRSDNIAISDITGILIEDSLGASLTDFNNLSHVASIKSRIQRDENVVKDFLIECGVGVFNSGGAMVTDAALTWNLPTATYFYRTQFIYDIDTSIGRTDSDPEQSIALTLDGDGLLFPIGFGARGVNVMCRIYRGTTTNSYDFSVDVPLICSRFLFDNGEVINGFIWKARTAGPVDTVNTSGIQIKKQGARTSLISPATPTVGTYVAGDIIYDDNPTAGGNVGRVCVTSGTPGTWKTFGAISV